MIELKLRSLGNSVGTTIPRDMLDALKVGQGDTLYVQRNDDGSFTLTAHDPETVRQMKAMNEILRRDRDILAALA